MRSSGNRFKVLLVTILSTILAVMLLFLGYKTLLNPEPQKPEPPVVVQPGTDDDDEVTPEPQEPQEPDNTETKRVKVLANGDILIHDLVYMSAYQPENNTYDFKPMFEKVKPLLSSADLTLGNFEGSISDVYGYSGYPIFNAPIEISEAVVDAGYDVISLANNHILDSRGEGLVSTYNAFNDKGIRTMGVIMNSNDRIVLKEVNGIKIAMLAYSYGYNGMEQTISEAEFQQKLTPIDPNRIYQDIQDAKEISDVIIVYPHLGVEYMLSPTQEQVDLYDQMVEWGADVVFGNHPHVLQPTKVLQRDGLDKFILYSMGNFISNQRLETLDNIWTERGVIMEVNLVKEGDKPVVIESVVAHPTWVAKIPYSPARFHSSGFEVFQYQVLLTEDYLNDSHGFDEATLNRIRTAHHEVLELLNIPALQGGQNE